MKRKTLPIMCLAAGCVSNTPSDATAAQSQSQIVQKIISAVKRTSGAEPQSIYQYQLDGKNVYLANTQCCDHFNPLFNEQVTEICAPSGGFAGKGDGKCPDFETNKRNEKLIWKSSK